MSRESVVPETLSPATQVAIDRWASKFPPQHKASAVLYALRVAQEEKGYLSTGTMDAVASYLEMPKVSVYEVATFYSLYNLKPVGRYKISVCNSISCMLRGSDALLAHLSKRLGIEIGGTTPDKKFTLKHSVCLAACTGAPALVINDKVYHENVTPETVDAFLEHLP